MELLEADFRPRNTPDAVWDSIPPGTRIRFVRKNQYRLDLTPEQYAPLYRLPYWSLYGPEHGAPTSWFNPDGYLLPKFQPGGGRFSEFQSWRRRFRSLRWLHYKSQERYRSLRERYKAAYAIIGIVGYLAIFGLIWHLERIWFDEDLAFFPIMGMILVIYVGGLVLFARLQHTIVRRAVEKRWQQREDSQQYA
jgi:hypothetical protein